jgi:hypothetical protein
MHASTLVPCDELGWWLPEKTLLMSLLFRWCKVQ